MLKSGYSVTSDMLGQDLPGSAARVLHCWLCAVCMRVALGDVIWHPYHRAGCTRSAIAIKTVRAPRGGERSWFLITTLFPLISHSSRLSANRLRAAERNRIWSRQMSYLFALSFWYPKRPFFAISIKTTILHRLWWNCSGWQWKGRGPTLKVAVRYMSFQLNLYIRTWSWIHFVSMLLKMANSTLDW